MSDSCSHDCSNCSSKCDNAIVKEPQNAQSDIKNVIAVVSGKGGVGKSSVSALLASYYNKHGKKVAVLDADITGPSIPKAFGIHENAVGDEKGIMPALSPEGIKVMSLNLLVDDEATPVVWRGPVIASCVKQFWTDVVWGDVDVMIVDCPPGTGDVPLTVFQSIPIKGIVVVTSPQDLVGLIVEKAVNMANMMKVPVLGLVENMAYFTCPDCGKKHYIFGQSKVGETADRFGIDTACSLPINPTLAALCDQGKVELASTEAIGEFAEAILGKM